jgi:thiol-disulfide isomerase/thioredoxin
MTKSDARDSKRPLLFLLGLCVVLGALAVSAWLVTEKWQTGSQPPLPRAESPITAGVFYTTSFLDQDGHAQSLGQWQSVILVVNFWATWCAPCVEEMPMLSRMHSRYSDKMVKFVGIAADSALNVSNFSQRIKVDYPLLADEHQAIDFSKRLGNRVGLLPYTVIVRPGGEIAYRHLGQISEQDLDEALRDVGVK